MDALSFVRQRMPGNDEDERRLSPARSYIQATMPPPPAPDPATTAPALPMGPVDEARLNRVLPGRADSPMSQIDLFGTRPTQAPVPPPPAHYPGVDQDWIDRAYARNVLTQGGDPQALSQALMTASKQAQLGGMASAYRQSLPRAEQAKQAAMAGGQSLADMAGDFSQSVAVGADLLNRYSPEWVPGWIDGGENQPPLTELPTWQYGQAIKDKAREVLPTDPLLEGDPLTDVGPRALASGMGFLAGGLAAGGVKATGRAGRNALMRKIGAETAEQQARKYFEREAMRRLRNRTLGGKALNFADELVSGGATPAVAVMGGGMGATQGAEMGLDAPVSQGRKDLATVLSGLLGLTEVVPIDRALGRVGTLPDGAMKRIVLAALEEMVQEGTQTVGANVIADKLLEKPTLWLEGLGLNATAGGAVGGLMGAGMELLGRVMPGRARTRSAPPAPVADAAAQDAAWDRALAPPAPVEADEQAPGWRPIPTQGDDIDFEGDTAPRGEVETREAREEADQAEAARTPAGSDSAAPRPRPRSVETAQQMAMAALGRELTYAERQHVEEAFQAQEWDRLGDMAEGRFVVDPIGTDAELVTRYERAKASALEAGGDPKPRGMAERAWERALIDEDRTAAEQAVAALEALAAPPDIDAQPDMDPGAEPDMPGGAAPTKPLVWRPNRKGAYTGPPPAPINWAQYGVEGMRGVPRPPAPVEPSGPTQRESALAGALATGRLVDPAMTSTSTSPPAPDMAPAVDAAPAGVATLTQPTETEAPADGQPVSGPERAAPEYEPGDGQQGPVEGLARSYFQYLVRGGRDVGEAERLARNIAVDDDAHRSRKPVHQFVKQVAKAFGREVVFIRGRAERLDFNGVTDPGVGGRTLFINTQSRNPINFVVGHELLHSLELTMGMNNKAIESAKRSIAAALTDPEALRARLETQIGQPVSMEKALREHAADFVGQQVGDPEFWKKLARRDPGVFKALAEKFMAMLGKINAALPRAYDAEQWMEASGLNRARLAVRDLLIEVQQWEKAERAAARKRQQITNMSKGRAKQRRSLSDMNGSTVWERIARQGGLRRTNQEDEIGDIMSQDVFGDMPPMQRGRFIPSGDKGKLSIDDVGIMLMDEGFLQAAPNNYKPETNDVVQWLIENGFEPQWTGKYAPATQGDAYLDETEGDYGGWQPVAWSGGNPAIYELEGVEVAREGDGYAVRVGGETLHTASTAEAAMAWADGNVLGGPAQNEAADADDAGNTPGEELPFQEGRGGVSPRQDLEYLRAVQAGNMRAAQRLVDAAAVANGFEPGAETVRLDAEGNVMWLSERFGEGPGPTMQETREGEADLEAIMRARQGETGAAPRQVPRGQGDLFGGASFTQAAPDVGTPSVEGKVGKSDAPKDVPNLFGPQFQEQREQQPMTRAATERLLEAMEQQAEPWRHLAFTEDNWNQEFETPDVQTPMGMVQVAFRQFDKLIREGRKRLMGLIRPTLEAPQIVIDDPGDPGAMLFIKAFKPDPRYDKYRKKPIKFFISVTKPRRGQGASSYQASFHDKGSGHIVRMMGEKGSRLLHISDGLKSFVPVAAAPTVTPQTAPMQPAREADETRGGASDKSIGEIGGEDKGKTPEGPRFQETRREPPAPVFYSKLVRVAMGLPQKTLTADQVRAAVRKSGVKAEEIEWTGLETWLAEQGPKVDKAALVEFLQANQVQVDEVVSNSEYVFEDINGDIIGSGNTAEAARENAERLVRNQVIPELYGSPDTWIIEENVEAPYYQVRVIASSGANSGMQLGEYESESDAQEEINDGSLLNRLVDEFFDGPDVVRTGMFDPDNESLGRYANFQLEGPAEGYRELLLTLPVRTELVPRTIVQRQDGKWYIGGLVMPFDTKAEAEAYAEGAPKERPRAGHNYQSEHWDDVPNVLAHVRFNERTDAQGRRLLFVEEIQSDWHQAGREKGYIGTFPNDVLEAAVAGGMDEVQARANIAVLLRDPIDSFANPTLGRWRELMAATEGSGIDLNEVFHDRKKDGVPDAPFKKAWPELAMKRVIRWAAENGFDGVAWTTGRQQVERYETAYRQAVDVIQWTTDKGDDQYRGYRTVRAIKLSGGEYRVIVRPDGIVESANQGVEKVAGKPLADVVGKDVARQIMAGKQGVIEGDDLTIGGKGMQTFYDEMLPQVARKLGKRFKAMVGTTTIDLSGTDAGLNPDTGEWEPLIQDSARVHYLPITPGMRETAVAEGFPLFQARRMEPEEIDAELRELTYQRNQAMENARRRLGRLIRNWETDPGVLAEERARVADLERRIGALMQARVELTLGPLDGPGATDPEIRPHDREEAADDAAAVPKGMTRLDPDNEDEIVGPSEGPDAATDPLRVTPIQYNTHEEMVERIEDPVARRMAQRSFERMERMQAKAKKSGKRVKPDDWLDIADALYAVEAKTGVPVYRLYQRMILTDNYIELYTADDIEQLFKGTRQWGTGSNAGKRDKFMREGRDAELRIYETLNSGEDAAGLTDDERTVAARIKEIFEYWAPFVREVRFRHYLATDEVPPDLNHLPEAEREKILDEGRKLFKKNPKAFRRWIARQSWGTRKNYVPWRYKDAETGQAPRTNRGLSTDLTTMLSFSRGFTKTREDAEFEPDKLDRLLGSLHLYVRNARRVRDLEPQVQQMQSMVRDSDIDPGTLFAFLHNIMGIRNPLTRSQKAILSGSRMFWRALIPQQIFKWVIRNKLQPMALSLPTVGGSGSLDPIFYKHLPKFIVSGYGKVTLPEKWKQVADKHGLKAQYFHHHVAAMDRARQQFTLQELDELPLWAKKSNKFMSWALGLYDAVGQAYTWSDTSNRWSAFVYAHDAGMDAINRYRKHPTEANYRGILNVTGATSTLNEVQKIQFADLIDQKRDADAANLLAHALSDATQFRYAQRERGLDWQQPGVGGHAIMPIFTFTKGVGRLFYQTTIKPLVDGLDDLRTGRADMDTLAAVARAAASGAMYWAMSMLANEIMKYLYGIRKGSYGVNMLQYQVGGPIVDVAQTLSKAVSSALEGGGSVEGWANIGDEVGRLFMPGYKKFGQALQLALGEASRDGNLQIQQRFGPLRQLAKQLDQLVDPNYRDRDRYLQLNGIEVIQRFLLDGAWPSRRADIIESYRQYLLAETPEARAKVKRQLQTALRRYPTTAGRKDESRDITGRRGQRLRDRIDALTPGTSGDAREGL